jgi:hypothetical protein
MTHVDDFIDGLSEWYYARWFFALHRFPAALAGAFAPWINKYELYCTHTGTRWRVTGASRLGDIYLKIPSDAPPGVSEFGDGWVGPYYDKRDVYVNECTDWSEKS